TLDCSGYSAAQTIDLHPGSFSSVGGLVHNIGIATTAIIENAIGGGGNDTLIANELGCTLNGGGGNDYLIGQAGNDTLIDGSGLNTLQGGTGNDSYSVQSTAATVFEFANEGTDQVQTFLASYVLSANVENLTFIGSSAHTGTGNELVNVLLGNSGNDVLNGLMGNDTLT